MSGAGAGRCDIAPASAKAKALADLKAAHVGFKETALHIPEERLGQPILGEWSAKDIIAHIASWEELIAHDMRRIARGHLPTLAAFREADVDEWNASLMRGRRMWPAAQVYHEMEQCYDELMEALEAVPGAMFEGGSMVTNVLAICGGHYQQHGANIRQWREEEGI